jgi:hypothetical protein
MTQTATLTDDRAFRKYTEQVWRARGWIELGGYEYHNPPDTLSIRLRHAYT